MFFGSISLSAAALLDMPVDEISEFGHEIRRHRLRSQRFEYIDAGPEGGPAGLAALKREFGEKLKRFMLRVRVRSPSEAEELMKLAEV